MTSDPVRLLLVEDDADVRETVLELLELDGYAVAAAKDGAEGLRLAREQRPALVITDLMMPGLAGSAFVSELRADPGFAAIPVVVVSASGLTPPEGIAAYVRKPFQPDELLETLRRMLPRD